MQIKYGGIIIENRTTITSVESKRLQDKRNKISRNFEWNRYIVMKSSASHPIKKSRGK